VEKTGERGTRAAAAPFPRPLRRLARYSEQNLPPQREGGEGADRPQPGGRTTEGGGKLGGTPPLLCPRPHRRRYSAAASRRRRNPCRPAGRRSSISEGVRGAAPAGRYSARSGGGIPPRRSRARRSRRVGGTVDSRTACSSGGPRMRTGWSAELSRAGCVVCRRAKHKLLTGQHARCSGRSRVKCVRGGMLVVAAEVGRQRKSFRQFGPAVMQLVHPNEGLNITAAGVLVKAGDTTDPG